MCMKSTNEKKKMVGWMTCDFTSFSTVFQSYQDDRQMIMKGCVQWNPKRKRVLDEEDYDTFYLTF